MYRFILFLCALGLSAQTTSPTLDRPPQDVDDALRARIKQFYDYHVEQKTRLCEQLISEESKDDFYVMNKPALKSYKIGDIQYSDHFTKAKVVILGLMPFVLPMAEARMMDQPFASYWRFENGNWFWYYNKDEARKTPFGELKGENRGAPGTASSLEARPEVTIQALQSAVKVDRMQIGIAPGKTEKVTVTNTLPGPASLAIEYTPTEQSGIRATIDKKELKGNETAILSVQADGRARAGVVPVRITVSPTNQVLDITVTVQ